MAAIVVTALAGAALAYGVGARSSHVASAHALSAERDVANLARPAWYGLRVIDRPVDFKAVPTRDAPPVIPAAAGILIDVDAGTILWQQDAHASLPPASTTKILTALVALENFDPSRQVTVTDSALHQAGDETRMGISAGQRYSLAELLTGMLLVSGNDAATAVAEDTVGLVPFVAAMNAQVAALGLHDSHFTTPVGLQDPRQYASAYDLAAIASVAIRSFPLFGQIVAMRSATLEATADHPGFTLQSINQLLSIYPYATGIKPGWTGDAGYCEVGMAVRGGHRLISVLLNASYDFRNSRKLLDWGFIQEGLPSTLPPPPTPAPRSHG